MSSWLVDILVLLGILAIVAIAAWFILSQVTIPEPLRRILMVVLVVIAAIVAIMILLQMKSGVRISDLVISPAYAAVDAEALQIGWGGRMPPGHRHGWDRGRRSCDFVRLRCRREHGWGPGYWLCVKQSGCRI